ncbi:MAG: hypothetical protein ACSHYB_18395 [Roseibacillus sp.]
MKFLTFFAILVVVQVVSGEPQRVKPSAENPTKKGDEDLLAESVTDPKGRPYFPKGREKYYGPYYRAANLPSFQSTQVAKGEVTFRAAVFPSFSKPLFLTYRRSETGATISVARLSGRCVITDGPGEVELSGHIAMSKKAAKGFEKLAEWHVVRDPFKKLDHRLLPLYEGLDGTTWVLEVVNDEGYTMVDVQNPESFEYVEKLVREDFEKEVRKNPSEYRLPDEFKNYDLPDLDVGVLASFLEDLLMIAEVEIPKNGGDELPRHVGPN